LLLQLKYKSFLLRSFLQVNRERLKMFDKLKIKKQFLKKLLRTIRSSKKKLDQ
jgi:hypothetical protein